MKIRIKQILVQIAEIIYDGVLGCTGKPNGLYSGDFGRLLFLYYYGRYASQNRFSLLADSFADQLLDQLGENICSHTFCNGLSGILYLLEHLKENQFIELDFGESQKILDNYLIDKTNEDIKHLYYDFMHGALGSGIYFLKAKTNSEYLEDMVDFLDYAAKKDSINRICKWESPLGLSGEIGYNISLSHGMSSIIVFMTRYLKNNPGSKKAYELLCGTVNYILSQQIDIQIYGSCFPSYSIDHQKNDQLMSRLAWCYGDLGIATSLWQAGKALNNQEWKTIALKILSNSTLRRSFSETWVVDAGVCHGSAGVAMIYNRMYIETGLKEFLLATNYWMKQTLNCSRFEDGWAGYKFFDAENWQNDDSLLEGITGIGLMMVSYLSRNKQNWDELFLLS